MRNRLEKWIIGALMLLICIGLFRLGDYVGAVTANYDKTVRIVDAMGNVVSSFGGGGGGSGGATLTLTAGDGIFNNDAATTANAPAIGTHGNGGTTTAPAITTNTNGDYIITIVGTNASTSLTSPSGPTQINAPSQPLGAYQFFSGYTLQATAGTFAALHGTQDTGASGDWTGMSLALVPVTGQTPVFTAATGSPNNGYNTATNTVTYTWGSIPADGTLLIGCNGVFSTNNTATGTLASTFTAIPNSPQTSGHQSLYCYYRWAHSEPSSYTAIAGSGSGVAGFVFAVTNIVAFDQPITSAAANWGVGDVNKDLCVRHALDGSNQKCGTIKQVVSATKVLSSFIPTTSLSNMQYAYCTDHTSQWAALSTFGGGSISMPVGIDCIYGDVNDKGASTINLVPYASILFQGQGAGTLCESPPLVPGSLLLDMSTGGTGPVFTRGNIHSSINPTNNVTFTMQDMGIEGGAGCDQDGGGAPGSTVDPIDFINDGRINLTRSRFTNFTGQGVYVEATQPASDDNGEPSIVQVVATNSWFTNNNGLGLMLDCENVGIGGAEPSIQNVDLEQNDFVNNNGAGIMFKNCSPGNLAFPMWSVHMTENLFQNNHQHNGSCNTGNCWEVEDNGSELTGCGFYDNYFEDDAVGRVGSISVSTGFTACDNGHNTYAHGSNGSDIPAYQPTYSNAGIPIDPCVNQIGRINACVSDASGSTDGGTKGATYAHSGSALALVTCNPGTGWIETGTAAGCY